MRRRRLLVGVVAFTAQAWASDPRGPERYDQWAATHQREVAAFERYLRQQGVASLVPMWQLLRTATDWQRCGAEPFAMAPEGQWPEVTRTLRLLEALRGRGLLAGAEVVSAWRDDALNHCAGGSPRSAHVRGFAMDLLPSGPVEGLCQFWGQEGRQWNMGLSRYPSGRVHLDTAGYRTWGADYTQRTSFCH